MGRAPRPSADRCAHPRTHGRTSSWTVGGWIEHWLTQRRRAPNTLAHERSHFRTHFGPIVDVPLCDLTTYDCRAWLDDLRFRLQQRRPPLGQPHTVQHCYNLLRTALNGAMEHEVLELNPLASLPRPRIPKPAPKFLTSEEVECLLREVAACSDPRATAVHLMLRLGLRRGEALGLIWDDLDLDAGSISIGHQLQRVPDPTVPGKTILMRVAPKTTASVRTLIADEHLVDYLRAQREATTGDGRALVVQNTEGSPFDPDTVTAWLRRLGERAGVCCTPHRLRHTAATMMLRADIALPTVGAVLGHTDLRTTAVYARVLDTSKSEAIAALGTAIGSIDGPA